ncbi:MAG: hypothetical protein ACXWP6_17200, partial [Ktedonobacterales bacterium]
SSASRADAAQWSRPNCWPRCHGRSGACVPARLRASSKLAAMSEEEREAFWQQEAQDAARSGVAQQAQQAARDRVQRWQQWLADHPVMYDIHGTRRYYDANEPPRWFV